MLHRIRQFLSINPELVSGLMRNSNFIFEYASNSKMLGPTNQSYGSITLPDAIQIPAFHGEIHLLSLHFASSIVVS